MTEPLKTLLTLILKSDSEVLLARRRARQIGFLLGFSTQDQIRISTAVSEIVRNASAHAKNGKVEFCISDSKTPFKYAIIVSDKGPGIPDLPRVLSDSSSSHTGLRSAQKMMDAMIIDSTSSGTTIRLEKKLVQRVVPFTASEIDELANSLTKIVSTTPLDEVHQQNQELIAALDQLFTHQTMLSDLNEELKQKNEELVNLYGEVKNLNSSLEEKVTLRTSELAAARDDAVRANELKTQFVANISHEIRTPMSGILGLSELLVNETDGESKQTAEYVHKCALNLMSLVNDLLDMSKLETGNFEVVKETFHIDQIIDDVLTGFYISATKKNLKLNQNIDKAVLGAVSGAGSRIRQVLQNLVQNAIKFTDKGFVEIIVQQQRCDENLSYVKFSVRDTGLGIAEEDQQKLFKLFVQVDGSTTRRHGGTGLGLALSQRLVQLMGGSIGVESSPGNGSTFWFIVPLELGAVESWAADLH
ncbi:MAG TPA: ATP-binding protein [Planktothrix sp.]|jgi:signal transduction histidine kinase